VEYLRTITFILVIAVTVQFTEMVVKKTSPLLYRVLGIFLPLITVNCAVLGVALLTVKKGIDSVMDAFLYGFGAAVGFSLVLILFARDARTHCRCRRAGTVQGNVDRHDNGGTDVTGVHGLFRPDQAVTPTL
jgi:Na+-translocating ferredoxin:NAD+ oxidoreductase RnfA subunit